MMVDQLLTLGALLASAVTVIYAVRGLRILFREICSGWKKIQ